MEPARYRRRPRWVRWSRRASPPGSPPDEVLRALRCWAPAGICAPIRWRRSAGLWLEGLLRAGAVPRGDRADRPGAQLRGAQGAAHRDGGGRRQAGAGHLRAWRHRCAAARRAAPACALPSSYLPAVHRRPALRDGGLCAVLPLAVVAPRARPAGHRGGRRSRIRQLAASRGRRAARRWCERSMSRSGSSWRELTEDQLARWRAEPERPPLVYVRPRVERDATFRVAGRASVCRGGVSRDARGTRWA